MTKNELIEAVAIAMRKAYGEWSADPVIDWADAAEDKKAAWLAVAEAGIERYEEAKPE